jgi:GT2 family glycosyltransferase
VRHVTRAVSLILPNRNNDRVLDLFFEHLLAHTSHPNLELIVVDDGSTDRSREVLARWRRSGRLPELQLLEKAHTGIVDTLNAALERACGEVIVRLDGDATIESPGWLDRMLRLIDTDDRVGVVTGRTVFDNGRVHSYGFNVVGELGIHDRGTTPLEPPGERSLDFLVDRPFDTEGTLGDHPAEVDSSGGCCMAFTREVAEAVGGFDSAYSPVFVEDFDFAFAARAVAGKKVFYLPDVRIVHRVGLRNPRHVPDRRERLLFALRHRVGHLVPERARAAVASAAKLGHHSPALRAMVAGHYAHWRAKWGFDPVNPELEPLLDRYAGTEAAWAYDGDRRAAGLEILRRYAGERAASSSR